MPGTIGHIFNVFVVVVVDVDVEVKRRRGETDVPGGTAQVHR
jgi:hypothetical protein